MNNEGFEQFSMFNFRPITNTVLSWENSLSYSEELPGFIESLDTEPQSYSRISKWEKNKKSISMTSMKSSTGVDILDKRTLYVANSFAMAFEMCFERYCQSLQLNQDDYLLELENISIIKANPDDVEILDYDKDIDSDFYIISYLNDNYSGGEISFSNNGLSLKPRAASTMVIPRSELLNYHVANLQGTRYVSSVAVSRRVK